MAMIENLTTWDNRRRIGKLAWGMAWFGLVVGQLHALSRFATKDGKEDLGLPLTRAWAEPAAKALKPLLDWSGPDAVYVTYGKVWLPIFVAFTLCAFVVHHFRRPSGFEKWAWRVTLTGYSVATVSVGLDYWTHWGSYPDNAFVSAVFGVTIVGLLLTMFGSTALGISLLRNRFPSKTAAWLLTIALPFVFLITQVTSQGSAALPMMFAFGLLGRRLALDPSYVEKLVSRTHDVRTGAAGLPSATSAQL